MKTKLLFIMLITSSLTFAKAPINILVTMPDNILSGWDKTRKHIGISIIETFGDLALYDNYMKVLFVESKGFQNVKNPTSSASGIFQVMNGTLNDMNGRFSKQKSYNPITISKFRRLELHEQAKYLKWYLKLYREKLKHINPKADQATRQAYTYLSILYPNAIGKSWNDIVFKVGTKAYEANKGIRHDRDGIKVKHIYSFCKSKINK